MANTKSALKRVRQNKAANARNQAAKSRIRTLRKKVKVAAEAGNKEAAEVAYRQFSSALDKSRKSNLLHRNAANRLKSRMARHMGKAVAP